MELWEEESYHTDCAGVFLKTSDFKYSTRWRRRRIWEVFLKRIAKSMRGNHKKSSHVQPMQRDYVAIIWQESRLTLNVTGRESQGTKRRLTHQKNFPYSFALPNKGWQRNKRGSWRIAINGRPYLQTSMLMTSKSMDERKCINFR